MIDDAENVDEIDFKMIDDATNTEPIALRKIDLDVKVAVCDFLMMDTDWKLDA